jgi:hypothetical protein
VTAASLEIYQENDKSQTIEVFHLTEAWLEGVVTWDTAPLFGSPSWMSFGGDIGAPLTRSIDVQNLVQSWVDGDNQNYGLMLMATSGSGEIQFHSRESADPPKLVVSYGP